MHRLAKIFFAIVFIGIYSFSAYAQELTLPKASQKGEVTQRIGITDITITYHRPGVKGRTIWGDLVPYNDGAPYPWRAGANENTIIAFTHDVKINGKDLPAGSYGLHMIPAQNEWVIIFSKNFSSWGSYFYRSEEDALRVTAVPEEAPFKEWLEYGFDDLTDTSASAYMRWEKLKIKWQVDVDVHEIVLQSLRNELRSTAGFISQGWQWAAEYCLENNINHKEALKWIDRSISMDKNFDNLSVKMHLLEQIGERTSDVEDRMLNILETARENQINSFGYQLLNKGKSEKAIEAFQFNAQRNPNSWSVYNSLAEAYMRTNQNDLAKENFRKAYELAPDDQKLRLKKLIDAL